VRRFVELCAAALPLAPPVLEFGSFQVQEPCQEGLNDLRPLFTDMDYVGTDLREGPGVDVLMDAHDAGARTGSIGTVLLIDTLEHVEFPHRALEEVHRILSPRGAVILSSVMDFPIHEHPNDFWRFTPQGVKSILRPFPDALVDSLGEPDFPHTVVGIGLKRAVPGTVRLALAGMVRTWKQEWDVPADGAGRSVMERLMPPLVHELRGRARR
jgi:SAM-dependent methyltransferase